MKLEDTADFDNLTITFNLSDPNSYDSDFNLSVGSL